ncbi:hypothetical protein ACOME3_008677 [Neoechinorhynchus agilis]
MGSPLAPTLEALYMRKWENNLKKQSNIKKWYGYVDDVLIVTDDETSMGDLSIALNMEDHNIQWSMTQENEEGAISFLDARIKHDDKGNIKTQLYRKPATPSDHRKKDTTSNSLKYTGFHHISDTATRKLRRLKYLAQYLLIYNKRAHPLQVFSRGKTIKRLNQGSTKFHVQNAQRSTFDKLCKESRKGSRSINRLACRTFDKPSAISNYQQTTQHKVDFGKTAFLSSEPDLRKY